MNPSERLISFLGNPDSYAHRPARVELVQTHISIVALAGEFVFKVKKPLNLGFLDFSSLAQRRFYCEEEVRLNRRLCKDVYLGTCAIYCDGGNLSFEGDEADVFEYAVKMRRIAEDNFLHRALERGALTAAVMRRVEDRLVEFYRSSEPTPEIAKWGTIGRLRISTDENFEQISPLVGSLLAEPCLAALRFFTDRFYDINAALFARRRAGGYIRDCHGDLHLEHIAVTPTDVCIYDCIEFSERLRYIDVASDIAFLYMDLMRRGQEILAREFVAEVASAMGDVDMRRLVRFYAVYRAIVRGKVAAFRSAEPEVPHMERIRAAEESELFFQLALDLAVTDNEPMVVVVFGGVATGKSTAASRLGDALGWDVLSSDTVRKRLAGVPEFERGTGEERRRLYSPETTDRVYETLFGAALERIARGTSAIIDATFSERKHRDRFRKAMNGRVPYRLIEMTAERATVVERLRQREGGQHVSDARLEDLDKLTDRYEAPDALEDAWHFQIDTTRHANADETALRALKHMIRLS